MYKDKDKQREANRQAQARFKAKGITKQGITLPAKTDLGNTLTTTQTVSAFIPERTAQGNIRVSKLGDADYEPQCETTKAFVDNRAKRPSPIKQVKVFEDLPLDVQKTIDSMSVVEGKMDQTIKANRTAIAIHYQHLFPDRYSSTGVG
jgi:hypothetical protein